ncbi:MAG: PD-(D/E)XK nuclease family protein [Candidatus Ancillula sp.]|jgi:putative RecB family exonuclease|nr:PD-(D/E)XK nuclease family protein [Candidatus Ancillula sp.]
MVKWTGPSLSPTKIKAFKKCPLSYRLQYIDKIIFPSGIEAFRGTVTHAILEHIFDQPKTDRTKNWALDNIENFYNKCLAEDPKANNIPEIDQTDKLFNSISEKIENYFKLENPARLNPTGREKWVQTKINLEDELGKVSEVRLGGFIDRLEEKPGVGTRIIDYKTGKPPKAERFAEDYYFQMFFYSYVYRDMHNEIPRQVKLLFLGGESGVLIKAPTKENLLDFEQEVRDFWKAEQEAEMKDEFQPNKNPLCDWCAYKHKTLNDDGTVKYEGCPIWRQA